MIAPTPVWGIKVKTGPLSLGRALTGVLQAEARLARPDRRGLSPHGATRDRGRAFLGDGALPPPSADLDTDRVLRLRATLSPDFELASFETDTAAVAAEMTAALDFRPRPSALAIVERRSE